MILYHGSEKIVREPLWGAGSAANDYGRGFYCTEKAELGREWACRNGRDGFLNRYEIDMDGLNVIDLNSEDYTILHWLAVLTAHRGYWQRNSIAEDAKRYLQDHFSVDLEPADVVIGYRADDSYFSFAQDFIMGTISLQKLSTAMRLGELGEQVMLRSERAFSRIKFLDFETVEAEVYYRNKRERDLAARRAYRQNKETSDSMNDIFMIDIMRGRVTEDELRIR